MARRAFYSFHYVPDSWRASSVRNMGVVEGNVSATDNDWETVTGGGYAAIRKWIDDQLKGRGVTIVLVGSETAGRKWINYEIEKSWNDKKAVLGIHIHRLKSSSGYQSTKGRNPFEDFTIENGARSLASVVECYDPPYFASKDVYNYIALNLADWIEEAVRIRANP